MDEPILPSRPRDLAEQLVSLRLARREHQEARRRNQARRQQLTQRERFHWKPAPHSPNWVKHELPRFFENDGRPMWTDDNLKLNPGGCICSFVGGLPEKLGDARCAWGFIKCHRPWCR
jgi:hypothetical protein